MKDEKQYFAPLFLDDDPILPADVKEKDFKIWLVDGKKYKVYPVPVSKEVALECQKDLERDKKRRQRQMDKAQNRCASYAPALSLESLESDFESCDAAMQMDLVLLRLLFEELVCRIEKEHPLYGPILRLTGKGKTQKEIARILDKTQATVNEQQQAALKLLRKLYQEEK